MKSPIAIIGAGPAGIAVAIQLKRYGIPFLLFEKNEPGGLLRNANRVENYPGFPNGITGPQMVELLKKHLDANHISPLHQEVHTLAFKETDGCFHISTTSNMFQTSIVVVASGTQPRRLGLRENLPEQLKKYVLHDVHSIAQEKGKRILIAGAGDAAFDYALNLSKANEVTVINRGTATKALPLLMERLHKNPSVRYRENSSVKAIHPGENKQLRISIASKSCGDELKDFECDYLLLAIGRTANRSYYDPQLLSTADDLKKRGLLFEIGDVANGIYRQATIAVGNGIEAAMKIAATQTIKQNNRQ